MSWGNDAQRTAHLEPRRNHGHPEGYIEPTGDKEVSPPLYPPAHMIQPIANFSMAIGDLQEMSEIRQVGRSFITDNTASTRPNVSANCRIAREQAAALSRSPRARWLGVPSGLWASAEDLKE
jgi:hypothetical protein